MNEEKKEFKKYKDIDLSELGSNFYTVEERKARYKSELKKLKHSLRHIDKKDLLISAVLIKNLAFITVQMEELQLMVERDGYIMEYQNGENQKGTKKSVASELYAVTTKNYSVLFGKLQNVLPKDSAPKVDELTAMINKKKKKTTAKKKSPTAKKTTAKKK